MYRFILRSFDKEPTQEDINDIGQMPVIGEDGKLTNFNYTVESGWNTHKDSFGNLHDSNRMSREEMESLNKGWLQKYKISETNWYDEIMTIIEEAQLLQREYEGEQRNDDKSDALDELVAILDQAKDFAEVFS